MSAFARLQETCKSASARYGCADRRRANQPAAGYTAKGAHLWSVAYKGGSIDHVMDLQVAGDGVYVSGQFKQDLKIGSVNLKSMAAKYDVLVARFATKDGAPVWVKSVGSSGNDQGAGIGIGGGGGISLRA